MSLAEVDGYDAYYVAEYKACSYTGIDRIRSMGSSNMADYCYDDDGNYQGRYQSGGGWYLAEDDWCGHITTYFYGIDDSAHITNRTYNGYGENVVRFRFWADGHYYYTWVSLQSCLE